MSTTLASKALSELLTSSGGNNGYVMGPSGLYVPQAAPAIEHDANTHAPLGLRCRGPSTANLVTTSRPGVPSATYITTTDANGVITGQAARKWLRTDTNPDVALTAIPGATGIPGSDQTITFWAIFEQDPASPDTSTLLNFYRTAPSAQSRFYAALNLDTGVFTVGVNLVSATYSTALLQAAGPNGGKVWFVRMTAAVTNGETWSVLVYPCRGISGSSAVVGQSMFAHHFQREAGTVSAPSPIVTSGAATSRAFDAISTGPLASTSWWNPQEGTLLVDFSKLSTTGNERLFSIESNSSNRLLCFFDSTTMRLLCTVGGTELFRFAHGAIPASGAATRFVTSFKAGRVVSCRDGGTPQWSVTASPVLDGATKLFLGSDSSLGSTLGLNGHIKTIRYWPKAASADEIASITPDTAEIAG